MKDNEKLLSVCLYGRNDNYTPDFLYRLTITINFIAHSLTRIGRLDDVEIAVLDWKSEVPLADVVELTPDAAKICKFLYVPLEPGESMGVLPGSRSFNIALKHASGKYVSYCGADTLIPFSSFRGIFDVIEGRSFIPNPETRYFNCGRYTIPYELVEKSYSVAEWERYLRLNSWQIERGDAHLAGSFLYGGAGFLMFHKETFLQSGGLYESFDGWGWNDVEYTIRLMSNFQWYDLKTCGVQVFDMAHHATEGGRVQAIRKEPEHVMYRELMANGEEWGDPGAEIEVQTAPARSQALDERTESRVDLSALSEQSKQELQRFIGFAKDTRKWSNDLSLQELAVLRCIAALGQHAPILKYLEVGVRSGSAALYVGAQNRWAELYVVDSWPDVDDVTGPHCLGQGLYDPRVDHEGHVRLLNKNSAAALQNLHLTFDGDFEFDCAVIRSSSIDFNANADLVSAVCRAATMTLLVCDDETQLSSAQCLLDRAKLSFVVNAEVGLIAVGDSLDGYLDSPDSGDLDRYHEHKTVNKESYNALVNFYNFIDDLDPKSEFIIYGYGSLGRLIKPHLGDRVCAIVDASMDQKNVDGTPIISLQELEAFPEAVVLLTPVIYEKEIRQDLANYGNQILSVKF